MAENTSKRGGMAALALVALLAIGGLGYLASRPDLQPTPPSPPPAQEAQTPPPQFDIVRVDSAGNTVIAGRAAPGATITIKSGDKIIGTATADQNGSFAFLPDTPLKPGAQQLSLSETLADGTVINGPATASVDVPAQPAGAALAVLSGPNGSQVISGQGPQPGTLGMGTVDYDANGHAIFTGTAPAGAHMVISLGATRLGNVIAGPDGRWSLTATVPRDSGTISLNATDPKGNALPVVTAPFALETLPDAVAAGHIVISPGQNLWVIARHVYGHGNMYTLIYNANSNAIHDPDLIFPGQAFALPQTKG